MFSNKMFMTFDLQEKKENNRDVQDNQGDLVCPSVHYSRHDVDDSSK